jgi:hypothetical protein
MARKGVKAVLVLPVAVGNPDGNELRVLLSPDRLAGVEGQADRLAVQFRLSRSTCYTGTRKKRKAVVVAFRSIPAGATADGEILHVFRQEPANDGDWDLAARGRTIYLFVT